MHVLIESKGQRTPRSRNKPCTRSKRQKNQNEKDFTSVGGLGMSYETLGGSECLESFTQVVFMSAEIRVKRSNINMSLYTT